MSSGGSNIAEKRTPEARVLISGASKLFKNDVYFFWKIGKSGRHRKEKMSRFGSRNLIFQHNPMKSTQKNHANPAVTVRIARTPILGQKRDLFFIIFCKLYSAFLLGFQLFPWWTKKRNKKQETSTERWSGRWMSLIINFSNTFFSIVLVTT